MLPDRKFDGETLHEQFCQDYLRQIADVFSESMVDEKNLPPYFVRVKKIFQDPKPLNFRSYAEEFDHLIKAHDNEDNVKQWIAVLKNNDNKNTHKTKELISHVIYKIYVNEAELFKSAISAIAQHVNTNQSATMLNVDIERLLENGLPRKTDTAFNRFKGMFLSKDFFAQRKTGLTTRKKYQWNDDESLPIEIFMPTMAEFSDSHPRVSPGYKLFLEAYQWLEINVYKFNPPRPIVYYNLLRRDKGGAYERDNFESLLTAELEKLQDEYSFFHLITLPADDDLMSVKQTKNKNSETISYSYQEAIDLMVQITRESHRDEKRLKEEANPITQDIQFRDIGIHEKTKRKIFGQNNEENDFLTSRTFSNYDKKQEGVVLDKLAKDSMGRFRFGKNKNLSPAEFQAVYIDFRNQIITYANEELKPSIFNISCKHAIDRGGFTSAYYNFINSIEACNPLSKNEFLMALYAGAIIEKGRGMNNNLKKFWNALNYLYNADPWKFPDYVEQWLTDNDPSVSKKFIKFKKFLKHHGLQILMVLLGAALGIISLFTFNALGFGISTALINYSVLGGAATGFLTSMTDFYQKNKKLIWISLIITLAIVIALLSWGTLAPVSCGMVMSSLGTGFGLWSFGTGAAAATTSLITGLSISMGISFFPALFKAGIIDPISYFIKRCCGPSDDDTQPPDAAIGEEKKLFNEERKRSPSVSVISNHSEVSVLFEFSSEGPPSSSKVDLKSQEEFHVSQSSQGEDLKQAIVTGSDTIDMAHMLHILPGEIPLDKKKDNALNANNSIPTPVIPKEKPNVTPTSLSSSSFSILPPGNLTPNLEKSTFLVPQS